MCVYALKKQQDGACVPLRNRTGKQLHFLEAQFPLCFLPMWSEKEEETIIISSDRSNLYHYSLRCLRKTVRAQGASNKEKEKCTWYHLSSATPGSEITLSVEEALISYEPILVKMRIGCRILCQEQFCVLTA